MSGVTKISFFWWKTYLGTLRNNPQFAYIYYLNTKTKLYK